MSIRKKPEKAVPVLLDRLKKAGNHVLAVSAAYRDTDETHEFDSKINGIESKLKLMTDSLSRIKSWEKKVVDQFCALEKDLDDIFSSEDSELLCQPRVLEKFALIDEKVGELSSLISTVEQSTNPETGGKSIKPENDLAHGGRQTTFRLKVENKITESKALSSLCETSFHRIQNPQVRMCLLCLSVFPGNTPIKKRPLIYWWMGEGLVTNTRDGATAEEVGERVFKELLNEGFILPTATNSNSFTLCPWVRHTLILLAQENGFLKFSDDPQWTPCNTKRRAFLRQGNNNNEAMDDDGDKVEDLPTVFNVNEQDLGTRPGCLWRLPFLRQGNNNGDKVEDLLTVFNVNEQYLGTKSEWLRRLRKLEVLQMGRWQDSATHHIEAENYKELLFNGLGSQKHLKYLSLRGISRIETLPPTIRKLVSLQILDLRACHNLEELPPTISQLRNLTHLDVSECYLLETMPKGLKHLHNLQVLKGFVVGTDRRGSCKIADLARLSEMRKLSVRVRSHGSDQLQDLVHLSALRILTISWTGVVASKTAPQLPAGLTKLDLRSVPYEAVPDWLQPSNLPELEKLYIKGGHLKNLNQHEYKSVKFSRFQYLTGLQIQQEGLVGSPVSELSVFGENQLS